MYMLKNGSLKLRNDLEKLHVYQNMEDMWMKYGEYKFVHVHV